MNRYYTISHRLTGTRRLSEDRVQLPLPHLQCAILHGHDAETAFADYINGRREFNKVLKDYRR